MAPVPHVRRSRVRATNSFAVFAVARRCRFVGVLGCATHRHARAPAAFRRSETCRSASRCPILAWACSAGKTDAGQAAWNLDARLEHAAVGEVRRRHQLRPCLPRALRDPGQLQRLPDLGHLESEHPTLKTAYVCPASQSDVSVYRNLLFVSGEGTSGRIDCGAEGVKDTVSKDRLRGLRIFDISDIANPKNVGNVQTCRGSHTHTLLVDPKDPDNVYVYISGSAGVRSPNELAGCVERAARQGSEFGAVPHRSDQGAAGASRAGSDRQLAADLQRPHGAG